MELRRYLMAIGMRGNVNDQIGRDGAPAPSASTRGNVEYCPEADGTGVPSLHSQTVHAARRVPTAIM